VLSADEAAALLAYTLPGMAALAMQLPALLDGAAIPLLQAGTTRSITMSQEQVYDAAALMLRNPVNTAGSC